MDAVLAEARNHAQRTEVREVARCLEAYCHLRRGEPPIARALLDRTIPLLENRARRDLRFAVWMPVAQWLYGQVDTASPAPTIRTRPPDTVVNFGLAAWDSATPFRAREPRVAAMTASESQVGPGPTEGTR